VTGSQGAVQIEVQRADVQRQRGQDGVAENGRRRHSRHAVAGVDDDLQRADGRQVHEVAQVLGVIDENVPFRNAPGGLQGDEAALEIALGGIADIEQSGLGGDRDGPCLGHLHAVVLGGVVRRGESDTGGVEDTAREVEFVGRDQADLHDVGSSGRGPVRELVHEFGG
jgi:hypothetical protein